MVSNKLRPILENNQFRIEKWNQIYQKDKFRWGENSSLLAKLSVPIIKSLKNDSIILDIGCGYGRDSIFFIENEFRVISFDSSEVALALLLDLSKSQKLSKKNFHLIKGDILSNIDLKYFRKIDVFFSNYFLHLLNIEELKVFLSRINNLSKRRSLLVFNLISANDTRYKNKFVSEMIDGISWTFWKKKQLEIFLSQFNFEIIKLKQVEEVEFINGQEDFVKFFFCVLRKK